MKSEPPPPPSTAPPPPEPPEPGAVVAGLEMRPVAAGDPDRGRALAVLLTGRDAPRDPAVEAFEAYARDTELDTSRLWAGYDGARPMSAVMAMPSPGSTAMVLLSPVRAPGRVASSAAMVAAATAELPAASVRLVQCLLELDQLYEQAAVTSAGFQTLARLLYLHRPIEPGDDPDGDQTNEADGALPGVRLEGADVQLLNWAEPHRELFEEAIRGSYVDTLDCPGLVGTRDMSDIVDGHRGTGVFSPELWTVVLVNGQPAAILLLSALPARDAAELVYLGVTRPMRGRGIARQLLRRGLAQAARRGVTQMLLAVDEQNKPAQSLYRKHGFRTQSRRTALVRFLPRKPGAS